MTIHISIFTLLC